MDAMDQLKEDIRQGRVDMDRLIDVMISLQQQLEATQQQLDAARRRIEELEKKRGGPSGKTVKASSNRSDTNSSVLWMMTVWAMDCGTTVKAHSSQNGIESLLAM